MKELKIKIKDEEHYRQVQECLLALGYVISRTLDVFNVVKIDFLFCHEDEDVTFCSESETWTNSSLVETTLEELQEMAKEKNDLVDASWVEKEFEKDDREFNGYVSEWNYNLHLEEKISSLPFDIKKPNDKTKYFKARLIVEGEIVKEKDVEKFTKNVMEQGDMSKEKKKEFKKGDLVFDTEIGWCEIENVDQSDIYLYETERCCFDKDGKNDSSSLRQLFHSPQDASEYFTKIKEPISKEEELLNILYRVQGHHSKDLDERQNHDLKNLIEYFERDIREAAQNN